MADITIHGEELTFDLEKVTITEYRKFCGGGLLNVEDDAILAKSTGLPAEWFGTLSHSDYRRVIKAFFEKAAHPLADPN